MKSLTISTRLWLPVIVLAVVVVLMTFASAARTRGLQAKAQQIQHEQQSKLELSVRLRGLAETESSRIAAALLAGDAAVADPIIKPQIEAATSQAADTLKQLETLQTADEDRAPWAKVTQARSAYAGAREAALQAKAGGDAAAAAAALKDKLQPATNAYVDALQSFVKLQQDRSDALREAAGAERMRTVYMVSVVMSLIVAGLGVATWFLVRSISAPLEWLSRQADRIGEGDLSGEVRVDRNDEIGHVQQALASMQDSLNRVVSEVRAGADSIQTASREIASGNLDLSQRTEQTASNLQHTAGSMSELTGTVRQSAESAATANQLASSAAQVAQRGGEVVNQVVATMDEINASSKKISDIIGVIDGIAFQTNILALNAAVEAARAGEQGRGFAVVAGEVRSLAQRSAEAAKEIKGLIGTSVDRVEAGARLVQDAGTTMTEIVASVGKVTDIIGEIRASTVEQSEGIGSVNSAVAQLDQMTQQNAALVEESAAAAESMREQAIKLAGLVSGFKLQAGGAPRTPAPSYTAAPVAAPRPVPAPAPRTAAKAPAPARTAARPAAPAAPKVAAKPSPAPAMPAPKPAAAPADDGEWETF